MTDIFAFGGHGSAPDAPRAEHGARLIAGRGLWIHPTGAATITRSTSARTAHSRSQLLPSMIVAWFLAGLVRRVQDCGSAQSQLGTALSRADRGYSRRRG